jgi:hypothetical protein
MRRFALALALLTFFLNPGIACVSSDEPDFKYGEAEMKAAVEGTWLLTLRGTDGTVSETTLQIVQSGTAQAMMSPSGSGSHRTGVIRAAAACGSRTFVKSAGACMDMSDMPLDVAFVSGDPRFQGAALSGSLRISSLIFTRGQLSLELADERLGATIAPDGVISSPYSTGPDRSTVESLVRTAK